MDPLDRKCLTLDSIYFERWGKRVLQGAYLRLDPGTVCGLFGRNGSGKTTVIRIAAGQLAPCSGHVAIDRLVLLRRSTRRRFSKIAYLPQDSLLPGDVSVAAVAKAFGAEEDLRNDELLGPARARDVATLSGGEQRYLEVRLLMGLGRPYVLLDEPFTGVEPRIIDRIGELIQRSARRGTGVLLTDHYHRYSVPLVNEAYVITDMQCRKLNPGIDIADQLKAFGYLGGSGLAS